MTGSWWNFAVQYVRISWQDRGWARAHRRGRRLASLRRSFKAVHGE